MKTLFLFITGMILTTIVPSFADYKPEAGFVSDSKTAIAIAVAVLSPIIGEEKTQNEKPYKAVLKDGVWYVKGTLPKDTIGGVAEIEISKEDARILRVNHSR